VSSQRGPVWRSSGAAAIRVFPLASGLKAIRPVRALVNSSSTYLSPAFCLSSRLEKENARTGRTAALACAAQPLFR
jgi:hypothetical protein